MLFSPPPQELIRRINTDAAFVGVRTPEALGRLTNVFNSTKETLTDFQSEWLIKDAKELKQVQQPVLGRRAA